MDSGLYLGNASASICCWLCSLSPSLAFILQRLSSGLQSSATLSWKLCFFVFGTLGRSTPDSVLRSPCGAGDWTPALASRTCTPALWVAFLVLCLYIYIEISDTEVYLECKVQKDNGGKQMSSFKHVRMAGNLCSCTENRTRCPNQWQNQNSVLWFVC